MSEHKSSVSVVIPAKNEAQAIAPVITKLRALKEVSEIIVVDDGSSDETAQVAAEAGAKVVQNHYSLGNGGAIKHGARAASSEIIVFMDADGQHDPADVPKLLSKLAEGYDLVVGARGKESQANVGRGLANSFYNKLSSYMTGHKVDDLTSGFRAVNRKKFLQFLYLLPNGFSYPTTSTMAFFRAGYAVAYVPISVAKRVGKSHIKPLQDGIRFLLIIFKIGTLYSPLKLFVPMALALFMLGVGYYGYTFYFDGRFTNMSALLLTTSLTIFLVGLVSEQITSLMYARSDQDAD